MNISMLLEMVVKDDRDRILIGSRDSGLTATTLLEQSRRAAIYFEDSAADYVGYFGLNSSLLPVTLFEAALAGIPFAPVNCRAPDEQLHGIISQIAGGILIADDDEVERLGTCGARHVVTKDGLSAAICDVTQKAHPLVNPEDIAGLLFTSGTTSEPKAAVLRQRHLVSYIISSVEFLGCEPTEAQLICVPPYHIAGISAVLRSLYSGRRIVYQSSFQPDEWVRLALEEEVTHAMVVPTMLGRILETMESTGVELPSLRHLSYGGGRMPLQVVERTLRKLPNVDLVNAYGLTETSSTIAVLTPGDHREAFTSNDPTIRARLGSVGRPLPILEVEVRGVDLLAVAAGERGEIWVRGEQVAGEYVGRNVLDEDGWFATRDAGWFDEAGFLYIDGRLDDVIVRGAENISPGEGEDVLGAHPAVAEVAVVGSPDDEWGEAIAAVAVLREGGILVPGVVAATQRELQEWVRARLRSTKTPVVVDFRPELPCSTTGKLLRRVLRDELATKIGA